jgi:hypothetical protein
MHCVKAAYNVTKAYNLLNIKIMKTIILSFTQKGQYASVTVFKKYWVAPVSPQNDALSRITSFYMNFQV